MPEAAGRAQQTMPQRLRPGGKDGSSGRLGPLTQTRLQQAPTKSLTLMEINSSAATQITGRKQRVWGLQAGQGELSAQAQLQIGCKPRSDLEEHLPKGERKDQPFSALHLDPQGRPL